MTYACCVQQEVALNETDAEKPDLGRTAKPRTPVAQQRDSPVLSPVARGHTAEALAVRQPGAAPQQPTRRTADKVGADTAITTLASIQAHPAVRADMQMNP